MAYLPSRLEGIKVGDTVRFMQSQALEKNTKLRCGWNPQMNYLCGQTRVITEEIMEKINANIEGRADDNDDDLWIERSPSGDDIWYISIDMIDFIREAPAKTDDVPTPALSIFVDKKDPAIIKEMIAKVDKTRFKKLLAIGCNGGIRMDQLSNEMVDKYLDVWANGKYEFYLLFGKKLMVEKKIDVEMSDTEMKEKVDELCMDFPQYCATINRFDAAHFQKNVCGDSSLFGKYVKGYSSTEKLTGFLASLLKDKKFDDAVATMISNRYVKAHLAISIDPYDYLTMSLNNHDWTSCQEIGRGEYSTGAASILLDDTTLVAFKYNGRQVPYTRKNYKFDGNDKSWRQCVYIDKNTSSAIFSRQYPANVDDIAKGIRDLLEETISTYLNIENTWKISSNTRNGYVDKSHCLYHDVLQRREGKVITHKHKPSHVNQSFLVGRDVICPKCGREINGTNNTFLCGNCR
jgi:hypothetical protein